MSYYTTAGLPYIGVQLHYGLDTNWPPSDWARIYEIFELSELARGVDQIDFTSHFSDLAPHDRTRTFKPGLLEKGELTVRGIWRDDSHAHWDAEFISHQERAYKVQYAFTDPATPLQYAGMAWISNYTLSGDLGDKFLYSVTLVFSGILQPFAPAPAEPSATQKSVPTQKVSKETK